MATGKRAKYTCIDVNRNCIEEVIMTLAKHGIVKFRIIATGEQGLGFKYQNPIDYTQDEIDAMKKIVENILAKYNKPKVQRLIQSKKPEVSKSIIVYKWDALTDKVESSIYKNIEEASKAIHVGIYIIKGCIAKGLPYDFYTFDELDVGETD